MAFCATSDSRYQYFTHKNVSYFSGTKVVLTNYFVQKYTYNGKPIWKYACFMNRTVANGKSFYVFSKDYIDYYFLRQNNIDPQMVQRCCQFFLIDAELMDIAIEGITKAIIANIIPEKKHKDFEDSKVMCMWMVYIFVLFTSLIFKEFYLIWIVASMIFFPWRKEKLNR